MIDRRKLKSKTEKIKGRLKLLDRSELFYLRKDLGKIKQKTALLTTPQNWRVKAREWLSTRPATVLLAIFPAIILIYVSFIAIWQQLEQPEIQAQMGAATAQTATVAVVQTETAAVMQTASAVSIANVPNGTASATETPTPVPTATQ